jgi:DNA-binding LytR/AlgR family response regulator
MKETEKAVNFETRRCMVLTGNAKLRKKLLSILEERDVVVYAPEDERCASADLYENYIDFLVIDVDCCNNKKINNPGFEFAYIIREAFKFIKKPIIFLAKDEEGKLYAYEKFNCIEFIIKPVEKSLFLAAVDKALNFSKNFFFKIPQYIKSNNVYISIFMDDVLYIDVRNRNVYFHMQDGKRIEILNSQLHYFAGDANTHGFIRIRRDTMVNARYISNIDFNNQLLTLTDKNTVLSIGNKYRINLEEYVKHYEIFCNARNKTIPFTKILGYTV